jgi:hypothetical protein
MPQARAVRIRHQPQAGNITGRQLMYIRLAK